MSHATILRPANLMSEEAVRRTCYGHRPAGVRSPHLIPPPQSPLQHTIPGLRTLARSFLPPVGARGRGRSVHPHADRPHLLGAVRRPHPRLSGPPPRGGRLGADRPSV